MASSGSSDITKSPEGSRGWISRDISKKYKEAKKLVPRTREKRNTREMVDLNKRPEIMLDLSKVMSGPVVTTQNLEKLEKVLELAGAFNRFRITHILRAENKKPDALSKLTTVQFDHLSKEVLVEELNHHSIEVQEVNMVVEEEGPVWMTPI
ncbi:hypothetical protein Tco_0867839 [Tanacetum coccineum]